MKKHSLTHRVLLVVVLAELLCAACFSSVALWHEWSTRVVAIDALLQGRSDSLLGAVQDAEDPADNVLIDPAELKLPSTDFYSVFNQAGTLLGGNEQNAFPLTQRAGLGLRSVRFHGQTYRVLERDALRIIDRPETGGLGIRRPITIVYAIPISTAHIWHEIVEAAGFYIATGLLFTVLTALVLLTLMRGLLRPVEELAAAAAGVSPANLVFTPPASAARIKELGPLLTALSSTLDGLRDAFERQHRFVGDAAHELKTAVAVLRSTIQVLTLRPRSVEDYQSGLNAALEDTERVEELITRMLFSAHMEEVQARSPERSDLARSAEQALQALTRYASVRHITLISVLSADLTVQVPPEHLRTLISNLVVNAIQHSHPASVVAVRVFRRTGPTHTATLEVEDTGAGVAARDLPFVFDRFYRADASRSRDTGGAGLGLAICRSIVEAAGGTLQLDSAPGRGTTATVTLALVEQPASP